MKNLHITHPEDLILDGKVACQNVIEIFRSAFDDYNQEDNRITTKYDGAPAIVFGTDPTNKRFFVDVIDYYIKFENIENDFTDLCNKLNIERQQLPRHKSNLKKANFHYSD